MEVKYSWEKLNKARKILGLPVRTTRKEIIQRYREVVKNFHPDKGGDEERFKEVNEAYELLMEYCNDYVISLEPNKDLLEDPEDWWFEHFGQDPIWGKGEE